MAQKFEIGQMVMVCTYHNRRYDTSDSWQGPYIVKGFSRKNGGGWSYNFKEDPAGDYVSYASIPVMRQCNWCSGSGQMEDDTKDGDQASLPFLVACSRCEGTGKVNSGSYENRVLNRKNNILSMENYRPLQLENEERKRRQASIEEIRQQRRKTLISQLVNLACDSPDPELAVADFVLRYSDRGELNSAAYLIKNERRKAAEEKEVEKGLHIV